MNHPITFRTHGSLIAMFAALGLAAPMNVAAIPAVCPDPISGAERASAITDEVTDNGDGTFRYDFRVCNISDINSDDFLRDWELPFFGTSLDLGPNNEAGITDFELPLPFLGGEGWAVELEEKGVPDFDTGWEGEVLWHDDMNPFFDERYLATDFVLHFYTGLCFSGEGCFFGDAIAPGDEREFSFTANYGPTSAPYQASWIERPPRTGDPQFPIGTFPNSPSLQQNGVPEPGSLALAALGLGMLARRLRRTQV
jgi:PEP-CTERM motif